MNLKGHAFTFHMKKGNLGNISGIMAQYRGKGSKKTPWYMNPRNDGDKMIISLKINFIKCSNATENYSNNIEISIL